MLDQIAKYIASYLGVGGLSALLMALGAIYIWYQHHRNKLLSEEIALEKRKREEFLEVASPRQAGLKSLGPGSTLPGSIREVLVVDDEAIMRDLLPEFLRHIADKIRVDTAADGAEGLAKCLIRPPTILITDILMPNKSGIDLIQALRAQQVDIPILVISGYADATVLEKHGIQLGRKVLFLSKPFRLEELTKALRILAGARDDQSV